MATPNLGFQNYFSTTLTSGITASDTTIYLNSLPTPSEGYLVIEPDSATNREIIYYTSKGANFVTLPSAGAGRGVGGTTAISHNSGSTVTMKVVAEHFEALQDGTAIATDTLKLSQVTGSEEFVTNFVASGCVWSGDAYGSTRVASMTSGVVYINGVRLTVAAVTSRTFTASKDTYVDLSDNGDGTALITYTEVTNNAASPALAVGSIRIAIIITGASNIANVGSINQGQRNKVLPIASSVPYQVTDSLGNMICNRNPNPSTIGYRSTESGFNTTSATPTQVTGLSVPVIVPAGRSIRVTFTGRALYNTTVNNSAAITVWDGTVGSGTKIASARTGGTALGAGYVYTGFVSSAEYTPSSSSITINVGLDRGGGGQAYTDAAAGEPQSIRVELV